MRSATSIVLATILLLSLAVVAAGNETAEPYSNTSNSELIVYQDGGQAYVNITDAVQAADPGDTIRIWNGTYVEDDLSIDKTLTIIGNCSEATIIDGDGNGSVVDVTADWVNISHVAVNNSEIPDNDGGYAGIKVENADEVHIEHVRSHQNEIGIFILNSNGSGLVDVNVSNNGGGLLVVESEGISIYDGIFNSNVVAGIYTMECEDIDLVNNVISDNGYFNIAAFDASNASIVDNIIDDSDFGIFIDGCNNTLVDYNVLENHSNDGEGAGLLATNSTNTSIVNNIVYSNHDGMMVVNQSTDTLMADNIVEYNDYGITVDSSSNNTIFDNVLMDNEHGITVDSSSNNTIFDNVLMYNDYGMILFEANNSSVFLNTISNSIFGTMLLDSHDTFVGSNVIKENSMGLLVDNSTETIIYYNDFMDHSYEDEIGLLLQHSDDSTIIDNFVLNNTIGMVVGDSTSCDVIDNTISYNEFGLGLLNATHNNVTGNMIIENNGTVETEEGITVSGGINLVNSSANNLTENILSHNLLGLSVDEESVNNTIDYNFFIENEKQADDESDSNEWDNGSVGNYWSDNPENDAAGDGIGDQTYVINATSGAQDEYPMMHPVASAGDDLSVDEGESLSMQGEVVSAMEVLEHEWTVHDGTEEVTLSGEEISHTFDEPGDYQLTYTITAEAGLIDEDQMTVTVEDTTPPEADAGPDVSVDEGETVTFDGTGSTDNVGIVNYTWEFTIEGETVTLYGESPSHQFDEAGTYEVTLTVKDDAGNEDSDTMTANVAEPEPEGIEEEEICPALVLIPILGMFALPLMLFRRRR